MTEVFEAWRGEFFITTDTERMDITAIYSFLTSAYWSQGISRNLVKRAVQNSLCFGLFLDAAQIGFARIITDKATFAYLCDVYVIDSFRGKGLGSWLMECVLQHPDLQGLRRISLVTRDAHELYRKVGFDSLQNPGGHMEIFHPYVQSEPKNEG